jgi:uncharacterized membrane protein
MALGTEQLHVMAIDENALRAVFAARAQAQRTKKIATGAVGIGGGAVAGMLLGPRFGADKKIGAMVGAGAGLLGALLVIRFT